MNQPGTPDRLPCRRHRKPRCLVCGLHSEICVCDRLPRIQLPLEVVLVQHAVETTRPTNTGRMVLHMLPHSRLLVYARGRERFDETPLLEPGRRRYVLFPREGAAIADRATLEPDDGTPVSLIVLDGTWQQASHMAGRITPLRTLPCLALPPGPPSSWDIRRPSKPEQLCTLEAMIRVVDLLGRHDEAAQMARGMRWINERMMYMKGLRKTLPPLDDPQPEAAVHEASSALPA